MQLQLQTFLCLHQVCNGQPAKVTDYFNTVDCISCCKALDKAPDGCVMVRPSAAVHLALQTLQQILLLASNTAGLARHTACAMPVLCCAVLCRAVFW